MKKISIIIVIVVVLLVAGGLFILGSQDDKELEVSNQTVESSESATVNESVATVTIKPTTEPKVEQTVESTTEPTAVPEESVEPTVEPTEVPTVTEEPTVENNNADGGIVVRPATEEDIQNAMDTRAQEEQALRDMGFTEEQISAYFNGSLGLQIVTPEMSSGSAPQSPEEWLQGIPEDLLNAADGMTLYKGSN